MLKQTTFLIAILLSVVVVQAQQPSEAPFAVLDKAVNEERWGGNKERLSKVFDDERRKLGAQFESELLKWLGADPAKHYWVSAFLDYESYLHGNKRLPELSLLIKEQGLELLRGKSDDESLGYIVGLSVTAATLSAELGLEPLAISHKTAAQAMLQVNPLLGGHVPSMSEAEWRRYDAIKAPGLPKNPKVVVDDGSGNSPAPLMGGVLNGRAIKLPKPGYPKAAREAGASGQVTVRVLIDVTGRVISAVATAGHPELRKVSEDAAMKAEFTPTKLGGQAVKVSGTIIYNFVYR
jgi:TonB family protein